MVVNRDSTPPPVIGKIGPYTVFITPPSTPKPVEQAVFDSPKKVVLPPVQPPPHQFDKSVAVSEGSFLGFFKNAVDKVHNGMFSFLGVFSCCICFLSLLVLDFSRLFGCWEIRVRNWSLYLEVFFKKGEKGICLGFVNEFFDLQNVLFISKMK